MDAIFWDKVKTGIKDLLPSHIYRMWIEPLGFGSCEDRRLELVCINAFSKKRVQEQFASLIKNELEKSTGKSFDLSFDILPKKTRANTPEPLLSSYSYKGSSEIQMELPHISSQLASNRMLRKNFIFDRFVVGQNNDFAYSAALSLASNKKSPLKTLFLSSSTGMGKSHLAHAAGHRILEQFPDKRIYYVTAEDFTNEMVNAIKSSSMDIFKEKYRTQCDVLLMEDVHFLTGKDKTQQELAMTLDYLFEADKKIIFSGSALPAEIPKINEQLRSRFSSGVISPIERADFKTRLRIVKAKCEEKGLDLPLKVMEYLASELNDNVRQLESGVFGISTKHSLLGSSLDLNLAKNVVKTLILPKKAITLDSIKTLVCREFGILPEEIASKSRKRALVRSRQLAIYLARKYTDQSIQAIGRSFNRYHATAIHSINMVEKGVREKNSLGKQLDILVKKIERGDF